MSLLLLFNQAPWQDYLVQTAKRLAAEGQHEIAVVTAIMACETAAERAFTYWFQKNGFSTELEAATTTFFSGYSLSNQRLLKFYVALSGDKIQDSAFWANYKAAATLRGEVVHGGSRATKRQAEDAVEAAAAFTLHLANAAR